VIVRLLEVTQRELDEAIAYCLRNPVRVAR
jgi:hypothetical protein